MRQSVELRITSLFIITATLCSIPVRSDPCSTQKGRVDAYQACFANEGIRADDVFDWYRSYAAPEDIYEVPTELLFAQHGDSLCINHTQGFKNAIICCYQTDVNCAPPFERDLLVKPDMMARTIDPLCAKRKEIDFNCALSRHGHLLECAREKASEYSKPSLTNVELQCLSYRLLIECTKREFKPCGCVTSKSYSDIALDLLTPDNCPTEVFRKNRVVCKKTEINAFVDDGLGNGSENRESFSVFLWLLPLSVFLVKLV